jgi:hypothetical protein
MGGRPVRQNGEGHQDYTQEDNQRNLEYEGPQPQLLYIQIVQDFLLMGVSWTRQHIVCLLHVISLASPLCRSRWTYMNDL